MKRILSLILATIMLLTMGLFNASAHWAEGDFAYLTEGKILNEDFSEVVSADKDGDIQREAFFALVVSALFGKQEQVKEFSAFSDFSAASPQYSGYLAKAYEAKILLGYTDKSGKSTMAPKNTITRQEAATVLGRALGLASGIEPRFNDEAQIADFAKNYVSGCTRAALLAGYTTGDFKPTKGITRAEAVKLIGTAIKSGFTKPLKTTIFAGNTAKGANDGGVLESSFNGPTAVLVQNGIVYVADTENNLIRRIENGRTSVYAGQILGHDAYKAALNGLHNNTVKKALFAHPAALLQQGSAMLVLDRENHSIRSISGGNVTTLAGTGMAGYTDGEKTKAQFNSPAGFCGDDKGNLYIADTGNQVIRKMDNKGMVTTLAGKQGTGGYGDGAVAEALFNSPTGVVFVDGALYVTDGGNNRIRKIVDGIVTTVAGSGTEYYEETIDLMGDYQDGKALSAAFYNPTGICAGKDGALYIADTGNGLVRKLQNDMVTTVSGMGAAMTADSGHVANAFVSPRGIMLDGETLYVTDSFKNVVMKIEGVK